MGRRLRHHLPGSPFHLTARVQGRGPLFCGLEGRVTRAVLQATARSDVRLLAWAIMPNHLHLVVIQGKRPLSSYMQPLMRRLAWMASTVHGHDGHVFERRFHSLPCLDPDHLRNAIAYVHLNFVRAGLRATADDACASSHQYYARIGRHPSSPSELDVERGLRLFCDVAAPDAGTRAADYQRFIGWRMAADRAERAGTVAPPPPTCRAGNSYWATEMCTWSMGEGTKMRLDLPEIARAVLLEHEPGMSLEVLRSGERMRPLVRVRRRFIARALENGHSGVRIAEYLRISSSAVSLAISSRPA
jgi:REP element-mobilizing transposase RayT